MKNIISVLIFALISALIINTMISVVTCVITADVKKVIDHGLFTETAYAFYSTGGNLEKIQIYSGGVARAPFVLPLAITDYDTLALCRDRYGF